MFYLALLLLILLVLVAILVVVQNYTVLLTSVHLTIFSWHLPSIPLFLLCLLGVFLGGLVLYIVSSLSARRDAQEIDKLRVLVEKLTAHTQMRPSSGLLSGIIVPPVVPIPGISPTNTGPLGSTNTGPLGSRSGPANAPQNPSSSGSFSHFSFSPGQGQAPQMPQTGAPRPPFSSQ